MTNELKVIQHLNSELDRCKDIASVPAWAGEDDDVIISDAVLSRAHSLYTVTVVLPFTLAGNMSTFEIPDIPLPKLSPCSDGSIDVHWDKPFSILINVPGKIEDPISWASRDMEGNTMRGVCKTTKGLEDLSVWLKAQLLLSVREAK